MFAIGDEEWPGISKLVEEMGEVHEVIGKLMGTRGEEMHWKGINLTEALLDEMADVQAAVDLVLEANPFTVEQVIAFNQRRAAKLGLFLQWHEHEDPPPSQSPSAIWRDSATSESIREAVREGMEQGVRMREEALEKLVEIRPGKIMEMPPAPQIRHGKLATEGSCRVEGWHLLENCSDQRAHRITLGVHRQSEDWPERPNITEDRARAFDGEGDAG